MNLNERANYLIALLLSLTIHVLLLLMLIPRYWAAKPADLETFPVGLVEIAAGSPDGTGGMMGGLTEETTAAPSVNNPVDKKQEKEKTIVKPKVVSKSPPEDSISVSKKETGITDTGKKSNPAVHSTDSNGGTGIGGNSGNGKPFGFGTGEGMVTVLGPLPPYPKNAMNEGKEGNVAVRILVKADGSLERVFATQSSGDLRLDKAAVSVIERSWKFKPVTKDYYIDLIFSFKIDSGVTRKFVNSESRP